MAGASSGAAAAASVAGGMSGADPISAVVSAGTQIAETVAKISDANQRRRAEIALSYLNNQQRNDLELKLMKANTDTARLQILSSSIVQYAIANDAKVATGKTAMYVLAAGLGVTLLIIAVVLYKSK